jgi:hypothetical protein
MQQLYQPPIGMHNTSKLTRKTAIQQLDPLPAFRWEYNYKGLNMAQLLGQLGVYQSIQL